MAERAEQPLAPVILRRDALMAGLVDEEITRLRRRGQWTSLQRGAYLDGDPRLGRRARHLLRVHATLAGLRRPAVVSHVSAAAVHGLPLWGLPLQRVHITRRPPARGDVDTRLHSHVARLTDDEVVSVGGLVVTSLARTVVDIGRTAGFGPALAVADAGLRSGRITRTQLSTVVEAGAGTRGTRLARRVVEAADGRSESVGESRSRALMHLLRLPLPDLQVEIRDDDGVLLGRCDFGWQDAGMLGEFDGRVKYGRLLKPGQNGGDVVFEEKRREDALRDEGWGMVRWVWRDLDDGPAFARRLRARLDRQT